MKGSGDTIAAVATAPGRGGVAIVRVSGPDALDVAERLTGRVPQPRIASFASIRDPRSASHEARLLDNAVVIAFQSPHSYTGEDVVEFQCHGGAVAPRRVLEACFAAGARLARRGEFTERAFLNGKITYEQAEGVLDLVNAKTDRAADAALAGLAGARRAEMRAIYDEMLALSSTVEHALDVSEEELPEGFAEELRAGAESVDARLKSALRRFREGKILRDGALVVIAGPPNAGKSSLMNALLGESRAIVSDVPGTTRDSIEEWLDVGGWPVRLVDTAGLRETDDAIEGEGVARARELMARADVVVRLSPRGGDGGLEGWKLGSLEVWKFGSLEDKTPSLQTSKLPTLQPSNLPSVIDVISKCDLYSNLQPPNLQTSKPPNLQPSNLPSPIPVSSKTGEGLDALRGAIAAELARRADESRTDSAGGDRAEGDAAALAEARAALAAVLSGDSPPLSDLVLLANALRLATETLGAAIGAEYSSDLLDSLFSRFCVGK